jgi:ABC-2 type transport system permease protein
MILRLAWLEGKLLLREPITLVFVLALPLVMMVVMCGVFGNEVETNDDGGTIFMGFGATDYYMGGYVVIVVAALGLINLPTHLATYRERGVLRRFEASSIPRWSLMAAQTLVMVVLSGLGAVIVMGVAKLMYNPMPPANPAQLVGGFLLAAVTFAAIGTLLGVVMPTARAAQGIGIMLWFVMFMLGGVGPPPEVLPAAMGAVGEATPLLHAVRLLQGAWLGTGWDWGRAGILAGILVVSLGLSVLVMKIRSGR